MRRSDRARDLDFSLALIDRCTHGVAAISTGEATPYCLPLSLVRRGTSLYFHCAKAGRKVDLLRRNPNVCVTFVGGDDPAYIGERNEYTTYFQSVIAVGTAVEVTDEAERTDAMRLLCRRMTPDDAGEEKFSRAAGGMKAAMVWRIDMNEISGKAKSPKP